MYFPLFVRFNDEDLRPYFPLSHVLEGMFNLTSFLFNVQIKVRLIQLMSYNPKTACYKNKMFDTTVNFTPNKY